MQRIKSFIASTLIALIVVAGFGFGIIAIGFAVVLGGAFALALRLAAPSLIAKAGKRGEDTDEETSGAEPAAA